MQQKEYYYSKRSGILLLLLCIVIISGIGFSFTHIGYIQRFIVLYIPVLVLMLFFVFFLVTKWIIPANKKYFAVRINTTGINLNNNFGLIQWNEIDEIKYKQGQFGDAITIKLLDNNELLPAHKKINPGYFNKLLQKIFGYNFSISTIMLENDATDIFNNIVSYYNKYKLPDWDEMKG